MELMKEQGQGMPNRPFIAIKSRTTDAKLVDSVWIGILNIDKKRVNHCH